MEQPVTQARKDELMDVEVTMDGVRAKILGRLMRFAIVVQLKAPYYVAQYAWSTVDRVVREDAGEFSSE